MAPFSESVIDAARPIPPPPPVTIATYSVKSKACIIFSLSPFNLGDDILV
jgi:hypothetical protein